MKPFIVIPGKKVKSDVAAVQVRCSSNGWMKDALTHDWASQVWGCLAFEQRFLVWESFKCHISDDIKDRLRKTKTTMGGIPEGCTKLLQPLDVSINKPFKVLFRELYDEWFRKCDFEYTKGGIESDIYQLDSVEDLTDKIIEEYEIHVI